jgi:hypothetical protein
VANTANPAGAGKISNQSQLFLHRAFLLTGASFFHGQIFYERKNSKMQQEFKVTITETVEREVWVTAEDPLEAQCIAEENYNRTNVVDVTFEVDPTSRRYLWEKNRED